MGTVFSRKDGGFVYKLGRLVYTQEEREHYLQPLPFSLAAFVQKEDTSLPCWRPRSVTGMPLFHNPSNRVCANAGELGLAVTQLPSG